MNYGEALMCVVLLRQVTRLPFLTLCLWEAAPPLSSASSEPSRLFSLFLMHHSISGAALSWNGPWGINLHQTTTQGLLLRDGGVWGGRVQGWSIIKLVMGVSFWCLTVRAGLWSQDCVAAHVEKISKSSSAATGILFLAQEVCDSLFMFIIS